MVRLMISAMSLAAILSLGRTACAETGMTTSPAAIVASPAATTAPSAAPAPTLSASPYRPASADRDHRDAPVGFGWG